MKRNHDAFVANEKLCARSLQKKPYTINPALNVGLEISRSVKINKKYKLVS